jgi:MoaA/NifB/PqqE/SkfB family radical SAM enzyme
MSAKKPTIKFLITASCNIRCSFCHNEFQGDGKDADLITFDRLKTIDLLRSISKNGKFADMKLSGGEPLTFAGGLRSALEIGNHFEFERKILVTNLLAGNSDVFALLKHNGVYEFRVNVPALTTSGYQRLTATSSKTFSVLLKRLELARKFGFYLRANTVVCNSTLDSLRRQLEAKDLQADPLNLFDEWFLIVDYRSSNKAALERDLVRLVEAFCGSAGSARKGRIVEYVAPGNRKLSIAKCTATETGVEPEGRDFYIRPPGELLTNFVPGFAYM